jgi:(p)ppGpp synthase/HD superfamily hydrolase
MMPETWEGREVELSDRTLLTAAFDSALLYATQVHGGQTRKGTPVPYVSHLLGVAALVLEDGGDEDEAIAALLHDACEDQGGWSRLLDIRARFGERVGDVVEALTDSFEQPKPPWRDRKEAYLEHLRNEEDQGVLRVSLADKVNNSRAIVMDLRELGPSVWDRFNAGRDDQLWWYDSLVEAFRGRTGSPLEVELERTVAELHRLA